MENASLTQIIEALLFSSKNALTIKQIGQIAGVRDFKRISGIIGDLNEFYDLHERAFYIQNVAGGYQIRTDPKFKTWINKGKLVKPVQMSTSLLETLSIICYRQPVTRGEVEEVRAVDSSYTIRALLDKRLIRIMGKKDIPGKPLIYGTTDYFLEHFGLKSLKDLPALEEVDILSDLDTDIEPENMKS